jgi:uncharacterized protein YbjT (DUF2867 family)
MKIVVFGGTGLIGSKLINKLRDLGHEAIAASPSTGVNTITGEGLAEVLKGTNIVVDVTNSPSFEDKAVLEFFETSGRNLIAAEKAANVSHHIALSVVGVDTDILSESGYFRAKIAQENLIKSSNIPYTIVRATQFFEFLGSIAQSSTGEETVHLPPAFFQPIASDDVATALLQVVLETPVNGIIEIAGPEHYRLSELVEQYLKAKKDPRTVIPDVHARYFGAELADNMLTPNKNARLGSINFKSWLNSQRK